MLNQLCAIEERLWIKIWGEVNLRCCDISVSTKFQKAYNVSPSATTLAASSLLYVSSADIGSADAMPNRAIVSEISSRLVNASVDALPSLPSANTHPMFYISIYSAIVLGAVLISVLTAATQFIGSYRASKILFNRLLRTVVAAPFRCVRCISHEPAETRQVARCHSCG